MMIYDIIIRHFISVFLVLLTKTSFLYIIIIMEYQKYGKTIVLRLDKGDDITESILSVAKK